MRLSPRVLLVPLVAVAVLLVTLQQTLGALRASGSWQGRPRTPRVAVDDPYGRVDDLFAHDRAAISPESMRNPFVFGGVRLPVVEGTTPLVTHVVVPKPPPMPTLTSIIWDADPRATVRYEGRDFSVRVNSLFADFRVTSISSNQVILDRRGDTIVLSLRPKGD